MGEKIPAKKLAKAAHSDDPKLAKRAKLTKTLKHMRRKGRWSSRAPLAARSVGQDQHHDRRGSGGAGQQPQTPAVPRPVPVPVPAAVPPSAPDRRPW